MLMIKEVITQSNPGGINLQDIIVWIKWGFYQFYKVYIFQIRKDLNNEVDLWEKFSTSLKLGIIM